MTLLSWSAASEDAFWQQLSAAPRATLLLDYDGTLAPFVEERDKAVPYPGVRERIETLLQMMADGTRVRLGFVTGRPAPELLPLLAVSRPVEVWGGHGAEHLTADGQIRRTPLSPRILSLLEQAAACALAHARAPHVEQKKQSVALHIRGMNELDAAATLEAVWDEWETLIEKAQEEAKGGIAPTGSSGILSLEETFLEPAAAPLGIHSFTGGIELRVSGHTKAAAVAAVRRQEPVESIIAFLGDDRTDEDAFTALPSHASGGLGVLVTPEPRATAACWHLTPPAELLAFLDCWITALR